MEWKAATPASRTTKGSVCIISAGFAEIIQDFICQARGKRVRRWREEIALTSLERKSILSGFKDELPIMKLTLLRINSNSVSFHFSTYRAMLTMNTAITTSY